MLFKLFNRITGVLNLHAITLHQLASRDPRYADPRHLTHYEARVFSQNGEDGVLQYLIGLLGIEHPGTFLEIGCGDGRENNTRALLALGWAGTWIEGSGANVSRIRRALRDRIDSGQLGIVQALVTPENVDAVIAAHVPDRVNVLSIDIDLGTHHVWRALGRISPEIAVVEYNPAWRPPIRYEAPFRPGAWWDGRTPEYGASLQSLAEIGDRKGYSLVGCDLCGVNAFFVRADLVGEARFVAPGNAAYHYRPARHFLSAPGAHRWK